MGGAFWDRTGLLMGCLEEEPRAGKGVDLVDMGRNKHGKIEGWGDRNGLSHVNIWLLGKLACMGSGQSVLSSY